MNDDYKDELIKVLMQQLKEKDKQIQQLLEINKNLKQSIRILAYENAEAEARVVYERGGRC